MGRVYARLALLLQGLLILTSLILYIAVHPETTKLLAQKVLKPNGITYRRIEGNLLVGITLKNAAYHKAFKARKLTIRYNLFKLLSPRPTIDRIEMIDANIWPNRLPKSQKNQSSTPLPPLPPVLLHRLRLVQVTIFTPKPVTLDLKAKNLRWWQETLKIPAASLRVKTPWAWGRFQGAFTMENPSKWLATFKGTLAPARKYLEIAGQYAGPIPEKLRLSLKATPKQITVTPQPLPEISIKEANTTIRNFKTRILYHLDADYLEADSTFDLNASGVVARCRDHLVLTPTLGYMSDLRADILASPYPLPSSHLKLSAAGSTDALVAHLQLHPYGLDLYSTNYKKFALHLQAKPHTLGFIPNLPDVLRQETVALQGVATIDTSGPLDLHGVVHLKSDDTDARIDLSMKNGNALIASIVKPQNRNVGIWKNLPPPLRRPIYLYLYISNRNKIFNATTQAAQMTLFENDRQVNGWADVAGMIDLDVKGRIHPKEGAALKLHTHIDSLQALLHRMKLSQEKMFDAEIDTKIDLNVGQKLKVRYEIAIPWYLYNPDTAHAYYGLGSEFQGRVEKEKLIVEHYFVDVMNHRFDQKRPSTVRFEPDGAIRILRFALLDHGDLTGIIRPKKSEAHLHLGGQKIHYKGPEGTLAFDANVDINATKSLNDIEGEIKLESGTIRYMPKKSYTVNDEDIVVIQDIKEPSHTHTVIDLHIYADKPIHYRTKMVKADFKPDITLWKEAGKPLVLLGIVRIEKGSIDVEDKHFVIESSEIYFAGEWPVNPWLDLHIRYDLDFNIFYIYVSHTLSDPVFYFSSQPPMSQNDIMSYILFGTPASSAFNGRNNGNSVGMMLLSAGLKNAIGSATGIKFDTFNILHTESGKMGVEIGKRLGHGFRILYRNDDISSFIIQYALSRSVRVEVDVKETGQGINILYFKDFKGPKRLNELWDRP